MRKQHEARRFAYYLIDNKKTCFSQLNDLEKQELTGMIIESANDTYCYEYISEADKKTELPYMLAKYMQTKNRMLGQDILDLMIDNAVKFSSTEIDQLLNEQEEQYQFDVKYHYCEA